MKLLTTTGVPVSLSRITVASETGPISSNLKKFAGFEAISAGRLHGSLFALVNKLHYRRKSRHQTVRGKCSNLEGRNENRIQRFFFQRLRACRKPIPQGAQTKKELGAFKGRRGKNHLNDAMRRHTPHLNVQM